jgi:hypothetical protein
MEIVATMSTNNNAGIKRPSDDELRAEIKRRRHDIVNARSALYYHRAGALKLSLEQQDSLHQQIGLNERTVNALCWALGEDLLWD